MALYKHFPILIYGAIKVSFLLIFMMSLNHANASTIQPKKCRGVDLLEQLAKDDPDALVSIREKAAQTKNGNARLWKISRDDVPDSWVFGTMHSADKYVSKLPNAALEAFENSQTVLVEIAEVLDKKAAQAQLILLKQLTFRLDGTTIEQDLTQAQLEKLRAEAELRRIPYKTAIVMQPWILGPAISSQLCELAAKAEGQLFLDALIVKQAKARGQKIVGLESVKEQFLAISSMPKAMQIEALIETLELGIGLNDIKETMKRLYVTGKISMISPMIRHFSKRFDATAGSEEFQQKIVTDRNINMVARSNEYFNEGRVFMAVGALHLPGEEGVLALLEKQGYRIQAVENPSDK